MEIFTLLEIIQKITILITSKENTDNISIKEHNGEIKSNSVIYNYNSENKTLDRKNFNEIVQNNTIANYLKNNYVDGDVLRQEIFNNLKAIDNNKDFNKATENQITYLEMMYIQI